MSNDIDLIMTNERFIETVEKVPDSEEKTKNKDSAEAKRKKEEPLRKEAAEKLKSKPKFYFDVKVETMLPATLTYHVLAEDAQQAAELIKGIQPNSVKHRLIGRKDLKLTVYDAGSTMIKWMKRLLG
jgi:Holliday junction resolvase-like predicted endonuclease